MNGSEIGGSIHKGSKRSLYVAMSIMALVLLVAVAGCSKNEEDPTAVPAKSSDSGSQVASSVSAIAAERGLTEADIEAAVKTFVASGGRDEYIQFASGGHNGQVLVIGIPLMRLLKVIGVFTPEPWQGWAIGDATESSKILDGGNLPNGQELTWGDTHHPALSETAGDYDGEWLFINEKANGIEATPEIAYGEVICEQCGMIVSDESQAAAYRLADGGLRIFDDLGDIVLYHRINPEDVYIFWVHDYQTGEWMHAPDAFYVATYDLVTPMSHGIVAFTYEAGAEHLAEEHGAPIYRWKDLVSDSLMDLPRHVD